MTDMSRSRVDGRIMLYAIDLHLYWGSLILEEWPLKVGLVVVVVRREQNCCA